MDKDGKRKYLPLFGDDLVLIQEKFVLILCKCFACFNFADRFAFSYLVHNGSGYVREERVKFAEKCLCRVAEFGIIYFWNGDDFLIL